MADGSRCWAASKENQTGTQGYTEEHRSGLLRESPAGHDANSERRESRNQNELRCVSVGEVG